MNQDLFAADLAAVNATVLASGTQRSVCTVRRPSQTADALGQPNLGSLTDVAGVVAVPCQLSPLVLLRPQETDEVDDTMYTEQQTTYHLFFAAAYPQIQQSDFAFVDGVQYDIIGIEPDSQAITTRLSVRRREL